jgi:V/A-type H+-transporting ATPase subunit A
MVYLQQDAFDKVDVTVSLERQKENFLRIKRLIDRKYQFKDKDQVRDYFTRLTGLYKNLNYAPFGSQEYSRFVSQIDKLERAYYAGEEPTENAEETAAAE